MKMLDLKINIKEKNAKSYADVAFLVDKESLLKDFYRLRKKWKIGQLIDAGNEVIHTRNIAKLQNGKTEKIVQPKYKDWLDKLQKKDMVLYQKFEKDMRYLLSKYKRHRGYYGVLESALLTGVVPNNTYKHTYWIKGVRNDEGDDFMSYGQPAIYVSTQTTVKDLEKELCKIKKFLKKNPVDIYEKYFDRYKRRMKGLEEIKQDRDVYWQSIVEKKQGRGFLPRLRKYIKQKYGVDIEEPEINKIIVRYEKALQL